MFWQPGRRLKGNIVGKAVIPGAPGRRGFLSGGTLGLGGISGAGPGTGTGMSPAGIPGLPVSGTPGTRAPPQKLEIIRHNLHLGTVLAVLLPAVLPEFPFNPNHLALYQVLIQGFSLPSPQDNVEKIRLVLPLIAVFPAAVYGDGEFTDSLPAGGITEFRIPGQPSNQSYMVYIRHKSPFPV
jgi:hypothetical protein